MGIVGAAGIEAHQTLNMANTKFQSDIEAVHNEWCRENGYPIRKRASRRAGGPTSSKQESERASKLNADNSERFVEGARSQALKRSTER